MVNIVSLSKLLKAGVQLRNPYHSLPSQSFWRRSISQVAADDIDPVVSAPFNIRPEDLVATAGSCFAQHISRTLVREGFHYLVTELEPEGSDLERGTQATFSARFGNIYTVRQLLQLFDRAYGLFVPADNFWRREDGVIVDPFRPRIAANGFLTAESLASDRRDHFTAVRKMFETCDIFVYTLGLTEGWVSTVDGAVFPIAPGVAGSGSDADAYQFENFAIDSMILDILAFIDKLRAVNRSVRLVLTVSPVPLVATYEPRHVLVSNTYSKSALRVVAEVASQSRSGVAYFPSFEIITGVHQRSRFYAEDLREVTPAGVAYVMSLFKKHYLSFNGLESERTETERKRIRYSYGSRLLQPGPTRAGQDEEETNKRLAELNSVVCEEELLDPAQRNSESR